MVNELEEELKVKIKVFRDKDSSKPISQTSIDLYASRVRVIYEQFGGKSQLKEYLRGYARVMKNLESKYSTLKSMKAVVWSIITVLKALAEPTDTPAETRLAERAIEKYLVKFNEFVNKINEESKEKEEKQLNGEIDPEQLTGEQIEAKIQELKEMIAGSSGPELFDLYQQYLLLNLYTMIPPQRNDFVIVLVYLDEKPMDEEHNYIFLNESKLVLNKYKTKYKYGTRSIVLPEELRDFVAEWVRIRTEIYPEMAGRPELLFNTKTRTPMQRRNVWKYLSRIFSKPVGVSTFRHVYVREKYKGSLPGSEMVKDAKLMGHSLQQQQTTYRT